MPEQREQQEKPRKVSRQEIEAAVKAGAHVAVGADVHRRGPGGRPTPPLPPPPADPGLPDEFEAVLVKDPEGRLTRAGALHAIRHGGSVMVEGEVYTDPDALPDLEEVHARAAKGAVEAMDRQIATMHAQRQQLAGDERAARGREPYRADPGWPQARQHPPGEGRAPEGQGQQPPQPQGEPQQPQPGEGIPEAQPAESEEETTRRGRRRGG
jgi:hypothetical protein